MDPVIFLKLGGSLITDKNRPFTAKRRHLNRIANEIKEALKENPQTKLVIGHGSGSFGHSAANQYHTRQGIKKAKDWIGFAKVWYEARRLNQIVVEALGSAGLPILAFPPSASVILENNQGKSWDPRPLNKALEHGLIPLINGDVVFDELVGGTILSTEEYFIILANFFMPERILLAGIESGIWADFPVKKKLIAVITPASYPEIALALQSSSAIDVTGGMQKKVQDMLVLIKKFPKMEALIFSGKKTGNILKALRGENPGTLISQSALGKGGKK